MAHTPQTGKGNNEGWNHRNLCPSVTSLACYYFCTLHFFLELPNFCSCWWIHPRPTIWICVQFLWNVTLFQPKMCVRWGTRIVETGSCPRPVWWGWLRDLVPDLRFSASSFLMGTAHGTGFAWLAGVPLESALNLVSLTGPCRARATHFAVLLVKITCCIF